MHSCGHEGQPDPRTQIVRYCHCKRCADEKPPGISMSKWSRLEVGLLADGQTMRVWCKRHDLLIVDWPLPGARA